MYNYKTKNLITKLEINAKQLYERLAKDSSLLAEYAAKPGANEYVIQARKEAITARQTAIDEISSILGQLANEIQTETRAAYLRGIEIGEDRNKPKVLSYAERLESNASQRAKWFDHY